MTSVRDRIFAIVSEFIPGKVISIDKTFADLGIDEEGMAKILREVAVEFRDEIDGEISFYLSNKLLDIQKFIESSPVESNEGKGRMIVYEILLAHEMCSDKRIKQLVHAYLNLVAQDIHKELGGKLSIIAGGPAVLRGDQLFSLQVSNDEISIRITENTKKPEESTHVKH